MRFALASLALLSALLLPVAAHADSLTYTFTGVVNGSFSIDSSATPSFVDPEYFQATFTAAAGDFAGWSGAYFITHPGPSGQTYTGAVLQETVTPTAGSNTCPSSIQDATSYPTVTYGTSPFTVGSSAVWEGQGFAPVLNSFYDSHRIIGPPDVLGLAGANQCAASAGQVYSCGSSINVVGSYLLTTTYVHGTLNGQSVTNEITTKQ